MRASNGRPRRRPRPWLGLAGLALAAVLLPYGWTWNDLSAHLLGATFVVVVGLLVLIARARAAEPARAYDAALERASALHVHLTRARVICMTRGAGTHLLTFTWLGARTDLLDADGRVLHSVLRNCLETGYTVTVPVDDAAIAQLLADDRAGGQLDVYACVDLLAHPDGGIARHGVVRDRHGVEFVAWSGVLSPQGAVTPVGSLPS